MTRRLLATIFAVLLLAGCSKSGTSAPALPQWSDDEVTFDADGLTLHGTYRHPSGDGAGPAALLISEQGHRPQRRQQCRRTDRQHASARRVPVRPRDRVTALRQGRDRGHRARPARRSSRDVGSAVYTAGAKSAVRFLAAQPGTDDNRISVYAVGEGTVHAMTWPTTPRPGPQDPLAGAAAAADRPLPRPDHRPSGRRRRRGGQERRQDPAAGRSGARRLAGAVAQVRATGTVPEKLPEGLSAIVNPGNVKAVAGLTPSTRWTSRPASRAAPGPAHLFGLRRPGAVFRYRPACEGAGAHRSRSGPAQRCQPRVARRPDRQHRELREEGSAVAATHRRPGRVRREVIVHRFGSVDSPAVRRGWAVRERRRARLAWRHDRRQDARPDRRAAAPGRGHRQPA